MGRNKEVGWGESRRWHWHSCSVVAGLVGVAWGEGVCREYGEVVRQQIARLDIDWNGGRHLIRKEIACHLPEHVMITVKEIAGPDICQLASL